MEMVSGEMYVRRRRRRLEQFSTMELLLDVLKRVRMMGSLWMQTIVGAGGWK